MVFRKKPIMRTFVVAADADVDLSCAYFKFVRDTPEEKQAVIEATTAIW